MATKEKVETVKAQAAGSSSQQATTLSPTSLLSQLRVPTQSNLMHKRKVRINELPHTGARKKNTTCSTDPKGVNVVQRAKEFSGEMITVSAGNLFCSACREELSLKLSVIKQHVQSAKHLQKKQLAEKRSREHDISQAFKSYEQEVHPSGETHSEAHKLRRVKVVTTFMRVGVPLAKIDHLKNLLEEHAYSLTDRRGMCDLIPFVQSEEQQQIRAELQGKKICHF